MLPINPSRRGDDGLAAMPCRGMGIDKRCTVPSCTRIAPAIEVDVVGYYVSSHELAKERNKEKNIHWKDLNGSETLLFSIFRLCSARGREKNWNGRSRREGGDSVTRKRETCDN